MTTTVTTAREQYDREGYATFPNVLSDEQVEEIREAIAIAMKGDWHLEQTFRLPEVAALLEHDPFIDALKNLMGRDFVFVPEQTALGHYFGPWHRDTDAGERAGHRYRYAPDFRQGTAVIYMRDQHPTYGGGLSLIPYGRAEAAESEEKVQTKAGDMLVFDVRLLHRATPPRVHEDLIPEEHRKSGIYFTVSANNSHAQAYRDFLATRGGTYSYLLDDPQTSYPPEVLETARRRNLTLMS